MTAPAAVRPWVVTYKSRPSARVDVWLRVEDVPADVDQAGVIAALEAWNRWPSWQARAAVGSVVGVRRARGAEAPPRLFTPHNGVITWGQLAPGERTITVRVPGALHAAVTRIARARGMALAGLVDELLRGLVVAEGVTLADPPPRPAPAFTDVPLPLDGE